MTRRMIADTPLTQKERTERHRAKKAELFNHMRRTLVCIAAECRGKARVLAQWGLETPPPLQKEPPP